MRHRSYAARRIAAALTPFSHLQRAPFGIPVTPFALRTADEIVIQGKFLAQVLKEALVLCHGFAASHRSVGMVWLAESLFERFDVLAFDWRGHGGSGGLASFGGAEAQDLIAVMAHAHALGYIRVGVVGESMGGLIALSTLGLGLVQADALATLGAPADYATTAWPRPQFMHHLAPRARLRPLSRLLGFRLGPLDLPRPLEVVGNIRVPLLLTHGTADRTVPVNNAYALSERAPHAILRLYEGVDHGVEAMRVQCPDKLLGDLHTHFAPLKKERVL